VELAAGTAVTPKSKKKKTRKKKGKQENGKPQEDGGQVEAWSKNFCVD